MYVVKINLNMCSTNSDTCFTLKMVEGNVEEETMTFEAMEDLESYQETLTCWVTLEYGDSIQLTSNYFQMVYIADNVVS
jgi:hypothetical protein